MRTFLISLVILCLSACGDSDPTSPVKGEGNFQLIELNGEALPYDDAMGCCIYTGGSLALEAGQYEIAITVQNKNNGIMDTLSEQGTYSLNGSVIAFQATSGWRFSLHDGKVQGNTITLALGGNGPGAEDQFRAVFQGG